MAKTHINPDAIHRPANDAYTHVVSVEAKRLVFVSGQVAHDRDGVLVGGDDIGQQARQVYLNLREALAAAGATPADIIKLTTYVVDYQPSHRPALVAARSEVLGDIEPPASVLLGVQALVAEDLLVEVDAVAALD